jgi:hypothetical protein
MIISDRTSGKEICTERNKGNQQARKQKAKAPRATKDMKERIEDICAGCDCCCEVVMREELGGFGRHPRGKRGPSQPQPPPPSFFGLHLHPS